MRTIAAAHRITGGIHESRVARQLRPARHCIRFGLGPRLDHESRKRRARRRERDDRLFDKDKPNAGTSACTGQCETFWPPYKASATDVPVGPYTIVKRDDGSPQWAYKGKPLYFFSKDMKQGDRNGENFKDMWHVVAP
ncbi:secreted repeat protein with Y-X4-D motif [Burkholderia pyrrocinia]|uniref:Secreted repeat protein with Y-X4-D motif n=1 Tax=Burkholderia pyrrocinia TaxID=60550 RepID=A0A318J344_BURPY|nr:secreted repeat protein with Y-X4-D motif [Burkholderia pyrrocinia]SFW30162.1 Secreted repeat of unknown function [Burkholderia sp. NFACC33-1]SFX34875.1 Secreted repeat of unknown function [Burkholderia sp. NFPP32]